MKVRVSKIITSVIFVAISLLAGGAAGAGWGEISPAEWNQGAPEDYPEADIIILFDSMYIGFDSNGDLIHTRHVRKKILNRTGIEEIGDVEIYKGKSDKFKTLKAHTIYPDGSVYEVAKDDFFTKRIEKSSYESCSFPKVDSGVIIEYIYCLYNNRYIGDYHWLFQSSEYTLKSIFSFEISPGYKYNYACSNVPESEQRPSKSVQHRVRLGQTTTYTWKVRNLPPVKPEPYSACVADFIAHVYVYLESYSERWYYMDGANTWKELGEGIQQSFNSYCKKPRGFRKQVKDITKGLDSKYDKSKALYDYVINNIQTRQDRFNLNFENENLSKMCEEKHGCSAEKNLLLCEMLRQAGIDAWPVMISTRDHRSINPQVPRWDWFDHLIVFAEVEQGGIYLDATSKYCAYGTLPPQCRTDLGFLIDDDKSELLKIVTFEPKSYRMDMTNLAIDETGKVVCKIQSKMTGYLATEYGYRYESKKPEDFINEDFLDNIGYQHDLQEYDCSLDSSGNFKVSVTLTSADLATFLENNLTLSPPLYMFADNPFTNEHRHFPIDFNYPFTYHNIVQIQLNDSLLSYNLPEGVDMQMDGGEFKRQVQLSGNTVMLERKLEVTRPLYGIEEYSMVKEFFEKVAELNQENMILELSQL